MMRGGVEGLAGTPYATISPSRCIAASEALADLRDHGRLGQGVDIDVGRSVTALARRRDCANAFLAHVRQASALGGAFFRCALGGAFFRETRMS